MEDKESLSPNTCFLQVMGVRMAGCASKILKHKGKLVAKFGGEAIRDEALGLEQRLDGVRCKFGFLF